MTDLAALPDAYRHLLTPGSGSEDGGSLPSMTELLLQMADGDPRMEALVRVLAVREHLAVAGAEAEAGDDAAAPPGERRRALRPALLARIRELLAELDELRDRNDALAAALGACCLCWGDDPACPACRGKGVPGAADPDPALFADWVAPSIRRLRARRVGAARPKPRDGPPPAGQAEAETNGHSTEEVSER